MEAKTNFPVTLGLQEIFKKKVTLRPAPQEDIRVPIREVSHQGSTPCAEQVLGGTGQDPDMGLDKLFHCSPNTKTAATASAA